MPRKKEKEIRVEDDPLLYYMRKNGSLGDAIELAEKWEKAHGIEPEGPPINTNTPAEDAYLAQMRRWTDFVTARGYSIAEERTSVYRRLWREFIAEEHARDPSIPISEWDD